MKISGETADLPYSASAIKNLLMSRRRFCLLTILLLMLTSPLLAQPKSQRLILKDGSYQIVRKYEVVGDRIRYLSAERGDWEEIPKDLIDWISTEKWAREHVPGTTPPASSPGIQAAAEIDKEEQAEREEAAARMPEVVKGLRLPDQDGVWALDTFHGQSELVRVNQSTGDVSQATGHNVLRSAINPLGGTKQSIQIDGAKSKVQLHVNDPAIYVSLDVDTAPQAEDAAAAVTVDTHGAAAVKNKDAHSSPSSHYAIVRLQVRKNLRVVGSLNVSMLGKVSQSEDLVDTTAEILGGKHWMKLTPKQPLTIGDYALVEVLSPKEINIDVWDFRIDPTAPDNPNSIMPLQRSQ